MQASTDPAPQTVSPCQDGDSTQNSPGEAATSIKVAPLSSAAVASTVRSYAEQCAALFQTCAALPGPITPQPKPILRSVSDVTLKVIGPSIEGQCVNLNELVNQICEDVPSEREDLRTAVKSMIIRECTRKSYSHEKQIAKRENVLDSDRQDLLWRWELKKMHCLGENKVVAMNMRAWLKKAQSCMVARHHAMKILKGNSGPSLSQRQQNAYEKAETCPHPGAPPVPSVSLQNVPLPKEFEVPETCVSNSSPAEAKKSAKERKSIEKKSVEKKEVEGFGTKNSLERSQGMMAMFVKKSAPKPASPCPDPVSSQETAEEINQRLQYIVDAIHHPGNVDVAAEWCSVLAQRWKPLGDKVNKSHVPGLPRAFARKAGAPRDSGKLSKLALGHENWQGIRTWRRKLLHFPSDSNRPPFYGSFSRRSRAVGPRRILAKDIDMDYEVLSDEEWEEEPEGEDLDGNDEDDDVAMEDEEEDDGFMVDDGYLSADECGHEPGSDDGMEVIDLAKLKSGPGKESAAHSILDQSTASYLNALLSAKNQGQPMLICRMDGMSAGGEGVKVRSSELLQPLCMHVLESGIIYPATACLDHPGESIVNFTGSAAAAEDLQKQLGPFVDSLSAEAARDKSAVLDAIAQELKPTLSRTRIANVILPAAAKYCASRKRWLSKATSESMASASPLTTASVKPMQHQEDRGCLTPRQDNGSHRLTFFTKSKEESSKVDAMAQATPQAAVAAAKKKRIQPMCTDASPEPPQKRPCSTHGNSAEPSASSPPPQQCEDQRIRKEDQDMQDVAAADSMARPEMEVDVHHALPLAVNGAATTGQEEHMPSEPPQPGVGGLGEWMEANPDRPRLPGGSGEDVLSPLQNGSQRNCQDVQLVERKPTGSLSRHESRGKLAFKAPKLTVMSELAESLHDKENLLRQSTLGTPYTLPRASTSQFYRKQGDMSSHKPHVSPPGLNTTHHPDLSPVQVPAYKPLPLTSSKGVIDVSGDNDDEDAQLQAALLASVAGVAGTARDHGDVNSAGRSVPTISGSSLAAQSLAGLGLGTPCSAGENVVQSQAAQAPLVARRRKRKPPTKFLPPHRRVSCTRVQDFDNIQLKKLSTICRRLEPLVASSKTGFSSWDLLAKYLALVPSMEETCDLTDFQPCCEILDSLNPLLDTAFVFQIPDSFIDLCARASACSRIPWLQKRSWRFIHRVLETVLRKAKESSQDFGTERMPRNTLVANRTEAVSLATFVSNGHLRRAIRICLNGSESGAHKLSQSLALSTFRCLMQSTAHDQIIREVAREPSDAPLGTTLHALACIRTSPTGIQKKHQEFIDTFWSMSLKVLQGSECAFAPRLMSSEDNRSVMGRMIKELADHDTEKVNLSIAVSSLEDLIRKSLGPVSESSLSASEEDFLKATIDVFKKYREPDRAKLDSMASLCLCKLLESMLVQGSFRKLHVGKARLLIPLFTFLLSGSRDLKRIVLRAFSNPRTVNSASIHQHVREAVEASIKEAQRPPSTEESLQSTVYLESEWTALEEAIGRAHADHQLLERRRGHSMALSRAPLPPLSHKHAEFGVSLQLAQGSKRQMGTALSRQPVPKVNKLFQGSQGHKMLNTLKAAKQV